jgi:hypothetical protein
MAVCPRCKREMSESVPCTPHSLTVAGERFEPIAYGQETRYRAYGPWPRFERCHDCWAPVSALHHDGCDVEECPLCHGQLISCDC